MADLYGPIFEVNRNVFEIGCEPPQVSGDSSWVLLAASRLARSARSR
jgi:hypothetical protein